MERILPPAQPGLMLRHGVLTELEVVSELGIYGVFLRSTRMTWRARTRSGGWSGCMLTAASAAVRASVHALAAILHSDGDRILLNEDGGHLLRTKGASVDEGGVAAGYAHIDSPLLD